MIFKCPPLEGAECGILGVSTESNLVMIKIHEYILNTLRITHNFFEK